MKQEVEAQYVELSMILITHLYHVIYKKDNYEANYYKIYVRQASIGYLSSTIFTSKEKMDGWI